MISDDEAARLAEKVRRLTHYQDLATRSAGDAWAEREPPRGVIPRELWLEMRATDLSRAIYLRIDKGFIGGGYHEHIQDWIEELQDIWQLVDRNGKIS